MAVINTIEEEILKVKTLRDEGYRVCMEHADNLLKLGEDE